MIKLDSLTLVDFDKNSKEHLGLLKKLVKDETILKRFQGFSQYLLHNYGSNFFNKGFLIDYDNKLVGFVHIGIYNELEDSVYLRCAIDKDFRGNSIAKLTLAELTEYIFNTYPFVGKIRLKIADDNVASLRVASDCGYVWEEKDYYGKINSLKENKSKR